MLHKGHRWLSAWAVLALLATGPSAGQQVQRPTATVTAGTSPSAYIGYREVLANQPQLLAKATSKLPPKRKNRSQVFVVSIAAGGSQTLFGREAEAMRDLIARPFGKRASGVLLSNAVLHHREVPLANRENVTAVLDAIGQRFDAANDLAVIFLTAHGAPGAWLQTDLPNAAQLEPLSAGFLAEALSKAGIGRRVVLVSACFSGSWIPPLASPDTIVITASSATRTSFGCDDRRDYTFFGAALLAGPLRQGASWRDAYYRLQSDVGEEENRLMLEPSIPMYSVGARMEGVWNAPLGGAR